MRVVTGSLMALLIATPLLAQQPEREQEREHVVRTGDTLWDLAGRYLANPFRWPLIHAANTRVVANPHWIYPDQVLVIPGVRDAVAGHDLLGVPVEGPPPVRAPQQLVAADPGPGRSVFYREPPVRSQTGPTVLMEPGAARVPVRVGEFYRAEFLAPPEALPVVARVVRSLRHGDNTGGLLPSAHPGDELVLSYETGRAPAVGERLVVVEVGRRVLHAGPEVRIIDPRAVVRVVELEREMMRVQVEQQFGRVISGHLVLPLELYPDFLAPAAEPMAVEFDLTGTIIEMAEEQELYGVLSRGFINLGSAHGVQAGDIFEAYLPPSAPRGAEATRARAMGELIPEQTVAQLRVLRVRDETATVMVDHITKPQLAPGLDVRRIRKMP